MIELDEEKIVVKLLPRNRNSIIQGTRYYVEVRLTNTYDVAWSEQWGFKPSEEREVIEDVRRESVAAKEQLNASGKYSPPLFPTLNLQPIAERLSKSSEERSGGALVAGGGFGFELD